MPKKAPYVSKELFDRLWEKCDGICPDCHIPLSVTINNDEARTPRRAVTAKRDFPHVDHIVPRSKGGSDDESNLRMVCGPCNRKKGNR